MFRWTACFVALLLVAAPVLAQEAATEAGNLMMGGAFTFGSTDNENATDRTNNITLAPKGMWFAANNFGVGLEVNFNSLTQGEDGIASHNYLALAQWVFPGTETFRPYLEGGGGFARQSVKITDETTGWNGFGLKAGLGAYLFVNEHISITPQISYMYESYSETDGIELGNNQSIYLSLGVNGFMLP